MSNQVLDGQFKPQREGQVRCREKGGRANQGMLPRGGMSHGHLGDAHRVCFFDADTTAGISIDKSCLFGG